MTTTLDPRNRVFTHEDFKYHKQGAGAAALAAKMIADGKTVSFDCYKRVKDEDQFLTIRREYERTYYFGLLDLKENIEGRSIALRVSHCSDLDAAGSSSVIASWTPKDITTDPVYIAAELAEFLSRHNNYFLNA